MEKIRFLSLLLLMFLLSCVTTASRQDMKRYAVVVDAGSTGSRAQLFEYTFLSGSALPSIKPLDMPDLSQKITPGIASYANDLEALPGYLDRLLSLVRQALDSKNLDASEVDFYLAATGGVRLLSPQKQYLVMDQTNAYLSQQNFHVARAQVIEGKSEAVLAWTSLNYLAGNFDDQVVGPTLGVLDMGGASIQIAFVPEEKPKEHGVWVKVGREAYWVYAYSYEDFGGMRAKQRWTSKECKPGGDFSRCRTHVLKGLTAFGKGTAMTGFKNVYQPKLEGDFVGIEHFSNVARFAQLKVLQIDQVKEKGNQFCNFDLKKLQKQFPERSNEELENTCFDLTYISTLLFGKGDASFRGLGFEGAGPQVQVLETQNVSWSLGFLLKQLV